MKVLNTQTITDYLIRTFGIENPNELFNKQIPSEKRHRIINELFDHFSDHRIDIETKMLMVENDSHGQIRTYYFQYGGYGHIQTFDQLQVELRAAKNVSQSIHDFHNQTLKHRSLKYERYFDLSDEKTLNNDYQQER